MKWSTLAGPLVAAIAIGASLVLYLQLTEVKSELAIEQQQTAALQQQIKRLVEVQDAATEDTTELSNRLMRELEDARAIIENYKGEPEQSDTTLAEDFAEPPEADATDSESTEDKLREIQERLSRNPQVRAQTSAVTELVYRDLFQELALPANVEKALKDLLVKNQIAKAAAGRHALDRGDVTARQAKQWQEDARQRLAAEIGNLLSQEEYAAWDAYEDTALARGLRATFRSQLTMFSSGLTSENHDVALDVAVEEFLIEQEAFDNSDTIVTVTESLNLQFRAINAMRERLAGFLSEEQYGEVENWFRIGEEALEAALPQQEPEEEN